MLHDLTGATSHLLAFLTGSLVWMVVIGLGVAVVLVASDPGVLTHPNAMEVMDGLTMGLTSALQIVGLAGLTILLALFLGDLPDADGRCRWWERPPRGGVGRRLYAHLGLRRPAWSWAAVGFLGGLTVWTLPSHLAMWLTRTLEMDSVSLEATTRLLLEGPMSHRLAMGVAVVVTAPIFEEVIFRGYLWELGERALGPAGAFVGTTLLFAGYHLDPIHTLSLLPTAAFLGALRLAGGSLWPCILAHFANNSIAVVVTIATADVAADEDLPLWLAVAGTLFTYVLFAAGAVWARRRASVARGALS